MTPNDAITISRQTRAIDGWFSREAALLFAWIDDIQKAAGIEGDLFEIGVHHGKSAALLAGMARPGREALNVCDIFGDQGTNVSASGRGDREVFEETMQRFLPKGVALRIHAQLSSTLSAGDVGTSYRFLHIDGGHNADEALSDLRLAADTLVERGVIAVDDPFRAEWPGVTEAIVAFLQERSDFCPLVVGFNKIFIARKDYADQYLQQIDGVGHAEQRGIEYPWSMKVLPFVGSPMRIFYQPSWATANPVQTRLTAVYRNHPWAHNPVFRPIFAAARKVIR